LDSRRLHSHASRFRRRLGALSRRRTEVIPTATPLRGQAALLSLTTGGFNTAVGFLSLKSDISGSGNTAIGDAALLNNDAGYSRPCE
jgi:hypothetical protein